MIVFCSRHEDTWHMCSKGVAGASTQYPQFLGVAEGLQKSTKVVSLPVTFGQIRGAWDALYVPPLPFHPTQVCLWLCF
jgi:hypothetical protein